MCVMLCLLCLIKKDDMRRRFWIGKMFEKKYSTYRPNSALFWSLKRSINCAQGPPPRPRIAMAILEGGDEGDENEGWKRG